MLSTVKFKLLPLFQYLSNISGFTKAVVQVHHGTHQLNSVRVSITKIYQISSLSLFDIRDNNNKTPNLSRFKTP